MTSCPGGKVQCTWPLGDADDGVNMTEWKQARETEILKWQKETWVFDLVEEATKSERETLGQGKKAIKYGTTKHLYRK